MGSEIALVRGRIELRPIPSIPRLQLGGQRPPSDGGGRNRSGWARAKNTRDRYRRIRYSPTSQNS